MKHTYHIHGMTCNGCRTHVEKTLSKVDGVIDVLVDLEKSEAVIEMESHIPIESFQEALKQDGGSYSIHKSGKHHHKDDSAKVNTEHSRSTKAKKQKPKGKGTGTFYCPMHCEGDNTYDKPGDCPVCGMDYVALAKHAKTDHSNENHKHE